MDRERHRKYRAAKRRLRSRPWDIGNGANGIPLNIAFRECDDLMEIRHNRHSPGFRAAGYLVIALLTGLAALLLWQFTNPEPETKIVFIIIFPGVFLTFALLFFCLSGVPFSVSPFFHEGVAYLNESRNCKLTGVSIENNRLVLKTESGLKGKLKAPDMMPEETQLWIYRKLDSKLKNLPEPPETVYPMPIVLPLSSAVACNRWFFLLPLALMVAGVGWVVDMVLKTLDHPERPLLYIALGMVVFMFGLYLVVALVLAFEMRKNQKFLWGVKTLELSPEGIASTGKNVWKIPMEDILEVYMPKMMYAQGKVSVQIYCRDGKRYSIQEGFLKKQRTVLPLFAYWNEKYILPRYTLDPAAETAELHFLPSSRYRAEIAMKNVRAYPRAGFIVCVFIAALPWIREFIDQKELPKTVFVLFAVAAFAGLLVIVRSMRRRNRPLAEYRGVRVTPGYLEFLGGAPLRIAWTDMRDRKVRPYKYLELMSDSTDEEMRYMFSFEYRGQPWLLPYSAFMDAPNAIQILTRYFTVPILESVKSSR